MDPVHRGGERVEVARELAACPETYLALSDILSGKYRDRAAGTAGPAADTARAQPAAGFFEDWSKLQPLKEDELYEANDPKLPAHESDQHHQHHLHQQDQDDVLVSSNSNSNNIINNLPVAESSDFKIDDELMLYLNAHTAQFRFKRSKTPDEILLDDL
jgi:hypothetical protein